MWALCGCTAKVDLARKYGKAYISLLKANHASGRQNAAAQSAVMS